MNNYYKNRTTPTPLHKGHTQWKWIRDCQDPLSQEHKEAAKGQGEAVKEERSLYNARAHHFLKKFNQSKNALVKFHPLP